MHDTMKTDARRPSSLNKKPGLSASQGYSYDGLNHLTSVAEAIATPSGAQNAWSQTYNYIWQPEKTLGGRNSAAGFYYKSHHAARVQHEPHYAYGGRRLQRE